MRLSYRHANVEAGNESFLLRYQSESRTEGAVCVLIDAGSHIDLSEMLGPADDLVALCLTHAHSDHYQSIGNCVRDETTVYASPPTAAVFPDVMEVAAQQTDMETIETPGKTVQPIDSWTDLAPGVSVHPVPAGHAPGAVGYLFKFADGTDTRHVLATGDFTKRRAAGYPGFDTSLEEIDVLFCTVATSEEFESNLSEGLGRALQRARAGATTLVATSGLLGVQVTYLLNELATEFAPSVKIRPVGHVATLYKGLDYDCRHVAPVEVFDDPDECLDPGAIAVAGPDVPTEGSSGRLFHKLRGDPNACVVQLYDSAGNAVDGGQCTVHSYETVNHPPYDALTQVHDEIAPIHTVIVHRHGGAGSEFNHLDSGVWAYPDHEEYTLYADGWKPSPRGDYNDSGHPTGSSGALKAQVDTSLVESFSLPDITRHETTDLAAEGVDVERIEAILKQSVSEDSEASQQLEAAHPSARDREDDTVDTDTTTLSTAASSASGETEQTADETAATTPMNESDTTATTESSEQTEDSTENTDTDSVPSSHEGLINSITGTTDGIDPRIRNGVANGNLDPTELVAVLKLSKAVKSSDPTGDETNGSTAESEEHTKTADEEIPGDSPDTETQDDDTDTAQQTQSPTEDGHAANDDTDTTPPAENRSDTHDGGATDRGAITVDVSALTVAFAHHVVDTGDAETVSDVISDAVLAFIEAFLAGAAEPSTASLAETLSATGPLADALQPVATRNSDVDDVGDLVTKSVGQYLGGEHQTVTVPGLTPYLSLLDAIVENDAIAAASRTDVIAHAVQYHVGQQGST